MTDQPYRSPAALAEPPERVETLALRRYPVGVQVFVLAWFPIVSLVTSALTPAASVACDRDEANTPPSCWLDRHSLFHAEHFLIHDQRDSIRAKVGGDLGAHRSKLVFVSAKTQLETEEIEVSEHEARAMVASYQAFFDSGKRGRMSRSIDSMPSIYALLALIEVALGLFFVMTQRKIFVDVNADSGNVHIAQGGRFGPILEQDLALARVEKFYVEEEETKGHRRRVAATLLTGAKEVLFDATPAEALRAAKFLETALQRWNERDA